MDWEVWARQIRDREHSHIGIPWSPPYVCKHDMLLAQATDVYCVNSVWWIGKCGLAGQGQRTQPYWYTMESPYVCKHGVLLAQAIDVYCVNSFWWIGKCGLDRQAWDREHSQIGISWSPHMSAIYVMKEDNDSNAKAMITQLTWTIWTLLSAVQERSLKLITHSPICL